MGIFRVKDDGLNLGAITESLTRNGADHHGPALLPAISEGDKRVLLIDGEPVPYALARIPQEARCAATLAAGGKGVPQANPTGPLRATWALSWRHAACCWWVWTSLASTYRDQRHQPHLFPGDHRSDELERGGRFMDAPGSQGRDLIDNGGPCLT